MNAIEVSNALRVEACGGFVQHQHLRLHGDHAGDCNPFLLAAAQVVGDPVCKVLDPDDLQRLVDPVVDRLVVKAEIGGPERDILLNGRGEDLVVRRSGRQGRRTCALP